MSQTTLGAAIMEEQVKPRIRYLGGTRYLVESRSKKGIGRQVDTLVLRCSCPAGQHGRRCWHLTTALAFEDWRKREEAKARAAAKTTTVQAANWSSTGQPATVPSVPATVPATVPSVPTPARQTGDLPPLSRGVSAG